MQLGADRTRADLEQLLARELEELYRVLVRVDEALLIDVEHHDRLGRVLDERAVTRLAIAQCLLVRKPLGDVPYAHHEAVIGTARRAAHGNFGLEQAAVDSPRLDHRRQHVDERVSDSICERVERLSARPEVGNQPRDVASGQLGPGRREYPVGGGVRAKHRAGRVEREDRILHVLENRVQRRRLVARLRVRLAGSFMAQKAPQAIARRGLRQSFRDPALEAILGHPC